MRERHAPPKLCKTWCRPNAPSTDYADSCRIWRCKWLQCTAQRWHIESMRRPRAIHGNPANHEPLREPGGQKRTLQDGQSICWRVYFLLSKPTQSDNTGLRWYSRITLRATGTGAFQLVLWRYLLHATAHLRGVFGKIDNDHSQTGQKEQKHRCIFPAPKAHCLLTRTLAKHNDYSQGRQPFLLRAVYGLGMGAKKSWVSDRSNRKFCS